MKAGNDSVIAHILSFLQKLRLLYSVKGVAEHV